MNVKRLPWLVFTLLMVLALVLSACGGGEAPPDTVEQPTEAVSQPTEAVEVPTEPEEEPTEAMEEPTEEMEETEAVVEAAGEPLKIGVLSDLTGALALFGNEMWNGLQIGFDYATDGSMVVAGRPIELIIRDDTSDVEAGTAAARELIEAEGVEILIGNASSGVAAQVQQIGRASCRERV